MKLKDSVTRYKPEISLDARDLPIIKKWEAGKKYCIILDVRMVNKSESKDEEYESNGTHARFKVLKARSENDET